MRRKFFASGRPGAAYPRIRKALRARKAQDPLIASLCRFGCVQRMTPRTALQKQRRAENERRRYAQRRLGVLRAAFPELPMDFDATGLRQLSACARRAGIGQTTLGALAERLRSTENRRLLAASAPPTQTASVSQDGRHRTGLAERAPPIASHSQPELAAAASPTVSRAQASQRPP